MTLDTQTVVTIVLAVISSNVGAVLVTAWFNRRRSQAESDKIKAETDDTRVGTALKLVNELQEQHTEANNRFREYRQATDETIADLHKLIANLKTELAVQEKAIDNLEAQNLKYQLVLSILIMQLRQSGLEPLVDPQEIDMMKVDDLKLIFQGMHHVEERRRQRQQERDNEP